MFLAINFLFKAPQCNLYPRLLWAHKLHWQPINEKLRAINIDNDLQKIWLSNFSSHFNGVYYYYYFQK